MMQPELTAHGRAATSIGNGRGGQASVARQRTKRRAGQHRVMMAGVAVLSAGLGGCINIAAPEDPIVIELNINIR